MTGTRFSRRIPRRLELNRLARERARFGAIATDLTVSNPTECGFPYPDDLLAPLAEATGLSYRPTPRGPEKTRRAIADTYRKWDVEVDPDRVVLTSSTSEAYGLLFKLLCDPGDEVLVPTPSYPLFGQLSRLDGVETPSFELRADDDWRPDLETIAAAPENTKAVILVHPNNPTGSHIHPDDAIALSRLCRERAFALIVDEVFLPFVLDGGEGFETSFAGRDGCLTFTLGGLSKSAGLPQLKLAWIVAGGPEPLVDAALEKLDYASDAYLSVNTPIALAAPKIISTAAPVQAAISERCAANLAILREMASHHPAISIGPVGGGWSAVLRLPSSIGEEDLAVHLLVENQIAVQPGFLYDLPFESALVLSLLTPETIWRHGLAAIFETVDQRLDSATTT